MREFTGSFTERKWISDPALAVAQGREGVGAARRRCSCCNGPAGITANKRGETSSSGTPRAEQIDPSDSNPRKLKSYQRVRIEERGGYAAWSFNTLMQHMPHLAQRRCGPPEETEVFCIGYLGDVHPGGVGGTGPVMGQVVDGMHRGGGHYLANDGTSPTEGNRGGGAGRPTGGGDWGMQWEADMFFQSRRWRLGFEQRGVSTEHCTRRAERGRVAWGGTPCWVAWDCGDHLIDD
jgi:hypothetical protein